MKNTDRTDEVLEFQIIAKIMIPVGWMTLTAFPFYAIAQIVPMSMSIFSVGMVSSLSALLIGRYYKKRAADLTMEIEEQVSNTATESSRGEKFD